MAWTVDQVISLYGSEASGQDEYWTRDSVGILVSEIKRLRAIDGMRDQREAHLPFFWLGAEA